MEDVLNEQRQINALKLLFVEQITHHKCIGHDVIDVLHFSLQNTMSLRRELSKKWTKYVG